MQPRYLTKSKFKLATECPTKLYYAGKKEYIELDRKPENWLHGWLMYLKKVRELNKKSQARN